MRVVIKSIALHGVDGLAFTSNCVKFYSTFEFPCVPISDKVRHPGAHSTV
jgi:hypothetical protein